MNVASFVHLFQALKHLASNVRNGALPRDRRIRNIVFQGHVDVLNNDVLCATHMTVTIVPDHSVAVFFIHHAQII